MKKLITTVVAAFLFVTPQFSFAQSSTEINQLLQEDLSALIALNGREAVEEYLRDLIAILEERLNDFDNRFSGSSDDLEIVTLSAQDIEDDEAELRGEVDEGDDVEVWFALSRTDSTPSCNSSSQRVRVSGEFDEGDTFRKTVDDLREDERYYYRACGEDEDGEEDSGSIRSFTTDDDSNSDDEPDVETEEADDVEDDTAELNGSVDMNDFNNGIVFFLWGQDEDEVEDATDEDEYADIDEDGDDLQKQRVDSDLDGDEDYSLDIRNLDRDEDYFFVICVEYEDDDNDETLECGDIEEFTTDDGNAGSDDEPEVETEEADDITDDSAELNGSVDMNDFNNGLVFFIYGEDEDQVEDAIDEDEFDDIDEDGEELQVVRVDSDLDGEDDYARDVDNLDDDTDHYFTICVEYEDEDDDLTLECGDIEEFRTDD